MKRYYNITQCVTDLRRFYGFDGIDKAAHLNPEFFAFIESAYSQETIRKAKRIINRSLPKNARI